MMEISHVQQSAPIAGEDTADWQLVARLQAGDDSAFNTIMERYKRPVFSFACRILGNSAAAEDVAQDVFVRAYQNLVKPGFRRTGGKLSTWLFQIARNAALDCLRRQRRQPADSLSAMADSGRSLAGAGGTAAEAATANEIGRQIAAAVALLPEDQRTAMVLAEYEQLSYAEIAEIMGCSLKSVEARLYRARLSLRRQLAHLLE